MKTSIIVATLVTALAFLAMPGEADNPAQSGSNGDCVDYNVTYNTTLRSPGAAVVTVDGGTNYTISSDSGAAFVDFYDAAGNWLGYNGAASSGVTPEGAVSGTICVGILGNYPDLPMPGATWTYQDGLGA